MKEYNVYANDIHSGKFQNKQHAINCAKCFLTYLGIKQVTVSDGNKVIKSMEKGGNNNEKY